MRLFRVTDCDNGQAVVNQAMQMVDHADGRFVHELVDSVFCLDVTLCSGPAPFTSRDRRVCL